MSKRYVGVVSRPREPPTRRNANFHRIASGQGFVPDAAVCASDVAGGRTAPGMSYWPCTGLREENGRGGSAGKSSLRSRGRGFQHPRQHAARAAEVRHRIAVAFRRLNEGLPSP